ncbi:acetyl/propionyl/methylcrotonyl-CoA carboxylase subunit alpha [Rubrivivax albus]|uniref:ATP-grasp domain-containing protein n=1 Tax=Rubrivivax albus TaxID=2499835 RepID=A0A437JNJ4_9BURK|nr:biotin carboxylase N-terminal domain-containing protein [Rubrivivax albus]RVT48427.1 ATP-grasp domain-containing protein [Rubrivivax albus]
MSFATVLIANRGEIACRVIRTAHRLGYRTVAVFSAHDAGAPHVQQADAAVAVPGYLDIAALLDAARRSGADAVHPGYGFLSERADFAEACAAAGLVFIGPPADAIRAMGDKARAKRRMLDAGVPCAPGYLGEAQDFDTLRAEAVRLGLPLLVKATAGGGGRGMRLVRVMSELDEALAGARREAETAFGDGTLMLERLIDDGRHIEVQVFADTHGTVVHLGERDCSAQRRRQKVIEEAPSPAVTPAMREALGRDAVAAARAVGYVGAGTVEFIVDAEGHHHFLEMNTRLQVEHPVTECVTGLDLVEWQLRVAAGEPLPPYALQMQGHAIEARLYAEDPAQDWRPQTGRVLHWRPATAGIRIDHGLAEGAEVTPHYDPMVAKLIAHGRDRPDAIRRLRRALADAPLLGLTTNAGFLRDLLAHPDFTAGDMTTARLDAWADDDAPILQPVPSPEDLWRVAAAVLGGDQRALDLHLQCADAQRTLRVPADGVNVLAFADHRLTVDIDGVQRHFHAVRDGDALHLAHDGRVYVFRERSAWPGRDERPDPAHVRSPVAGTLVALKVAVGDPVVAGQPLACVEAMKMEMWLPAGAAGTVAAVHRQPRTAVAAGDLLIELDIQA